MSDRERAETFLKGFIESTDFRTMPRPGLMELLLPSRRARRMQESDDWMAARVAEHGGRPAGPGDQGTFSLEHLPGMRWRARRTAEHLARLYRARGCRAVVIEADGSVKVQLNCVGVR